MSSSVAAAAADAHAGAVAVALQVLTACAMHVCPSQTILAFLKGTVSHSEKDILLGAVAKLVSATAELATIVGVCILAATNSITIIIVSNATTICPALACVCTFLHIRWSPRLQRCDQLSVGSGAVTTAWAIPGQQGKCELVCVEVRP
jgi:hypothetical protein